MYDNEVFAFSITYLILLVRPYHFGKQGRKKFKFNPTQENLTLIYLLPLMCRMGHTDKAMQRHKLLPSIVNATLSLNQNRSKAPKYILSMQVCTFLCLTQVYNFYFLIFLGQLPSPFPPQMLPSFSQTTGLTIHSFSYFIFLLKCQYQEEGFDCPGHQEQGLYKVTSVTVCPSFGQTPVLINIRMETFCSCIILICFSQCLDDLTILSEFRNFIHSAFYNLHYYNSILQYKVFSF